MVGTVAGHSGMSPRRSYRILGNMLLVQEPLLRNSNIWACNHLTESMG